MRPARSRPRRSRRTAARAPARALPQPVDRLLQLAQIRAPEVDEKERLAPAPRQQDGHAVRAEGTLHAPDRGIGGQIGAQPRERSAASRGVELPPGAGEQDHPRLGVVTEGVVEPLGRARTGGAGGLVPGQLELIARQHYRPGREDHEDPHRRKARPGLGQQQSSGPAHADTVAPPDPGRRLYISSQIATGDLHGHRSVNPARQSGGERGRAWLGGRRSGSSTSWRATSSCVTRRGSTPTTPTTATRRWARRCRAATPTSPSAIIDQLDEGVRSLEIDTHLYTSPQDPRVDARGPVVCHARGESEGHAGCTPRSRWSWCFARCGAGWISTPARCCCSTSSRTSSHRRATRRAPTRSRRP